MPLFEFIRPNFIIMRSSHLLTLVTHENLPIRSLISQFIIKEIIMVIRKIKLFM